MAGVKYGGERGVFHARTTTTHDSILLAQPKNKHPANSVSSQDPGKHHLNLPQPLGPMSPYLQPTLSLIWASTSISAPWKVMEALMMCTSRPSGCDASTPVTARCLPARSSSSTSRASPFISSSTSCATSAKPLNAPFSIKQNRKIQSPQWKTSCKMFTDEEFFFFFFSELFHLLPINCCWIEKGFQSTGRQHHKQDSPAQAPFVSSSRFGFGCVLFFAASFLAAARFFFASDGICKWVGTSISSDSYQSSPGTHVSSLTQHEACDRVMLVFWLGHKGWGLCPGGGGGHMNMVLRLGAFQRLRILRIRTRE